MGEEKAMMKGQGWGDRLQSSGVGKEKNRHGGGWRRRKDGLRVAKLES
jgi:hypothetical protein